MSCWNRTPLFPEPHHAARRQIVFRQWFSTRATIDRLILGQIPDIGFTGDDGFHGPKWSNFNQIIGSFKYTRSCDYRARGGQGSRRATGAGHPQPRPARRNAGAGTAAGSAADHGGAAMISTAANKIVGLVRYGHKHRNWLSAGALVMTLVLATARLVRFAPIPIRSLDYRVTVQLPRSGGLLPNQEPPNAASRVQIEDLQITAEGVNAVVRIDSSIRSPPPVRSGYRACPGGRAISTSSRHSSNGPFLQDGSVIPLGTAVVPQSLADTLTNSDGALKQMDTRRSGS